MFVAKCDKHDRIFSGAEIRPRRDKTHHTESEQDFTCPICEKSVICNDVSSDKPFDYFYHADGSADCFETDSVSDEHRLATEITVKCLHNRVKEVSGEPVGIDVERWVGIREDFIIADVRISTPLQVTAEIYYKAERLALGRRLETMFANDYRTYLIFHRDGRHDIDRIERYIQRVAPLRVGRFNPDTLELTLGDLFTDQIELNRSDRNRLPNYIAR